MKILLGFLVLFSSITWAAPNACPAFMKSTSAGTPAQKLNRYIDAVWKYRMNEFPEWAASIGYPGARKGEWTDSSLAAIERRDKETLCRRDALKKIDRKGLKGADLVNFDLLMSDLNQQIEEMKFPDHLMPMNHLFGPHTALSNTVTDMPNRTAQDVKYILSMIEKYPAVLAQQEILMREGLKQKVMPVKAFLGKLPAQFDKILTAKFEDSPMYEPFKELKGELKPEEVAQAQTQAKKLLTEKVYPALRKFREFVEKEYVPQARDTIAWKDMPNGEAWYAVMVRRHTTTTMKPEELHELGLKEVARIGEEMRKIREQVKFKGSAAEFNRFLLTDKRFFYTNKEDLLVGFRDIAKRIDAELPKQFKTLPRLPYGVREMPEYKAKDSPAAYYMNGSIEAGRAGFFEANTYDLPSRPKWGMEALTIHEAVPGHHLQIAIAQEIPNMPEFRKHAFYTAFIEGWALYSESLGGEMGFYKDPYSKYGQLSYEMWRAVRLVVDTGMHQLGWPREKAIEYMLANLPKTRLETEVEIDRYITWPGQALAYKVGELKIQQLKERSRAQLGEDFDVREFHDEVLKNGALPMDVLDKSIEAWISKRKKIKKTQT